MKTNNKTVHDLSRETLESYLNKNKPETSVWDIEGYQKERNNIIMLFSDAKECTFQPAVCTRLPQMKRDKVESYKFSWFDSNIKYSRSFKRYLKSIDDGNKSLK